MQNKCFTILSFHIFAFYMFIYNIYVCAVSIEINFCQERNVLVPAANFNLKQDNSAVLLNIQQLQQHNLLEGSIAELEPIPAQTGPKPRYTLDKSPINKRTKHQEMYTLWST